MAAEVVLHLSLAADIAGVPLHEVAVVVDVEAGMNPDVIYVCVRVCVCVAGTILFVVQDCFIYFKRLCVCRYVFFLFRNIYHFS